MAESWRKGGEEWVRNAAIFDEAFAPFSEAIVERSGASIGDHVLEVGCGSGALLGALLATGAEVVGVDVSPAMTAAASARVPGAVVVTDDAQTADLVAIGSGRPFDRIVSRFGVMFFDDPVAAFANMRRAAVPGATITFACWRTDETEMFSLGLAPLLELSDDPPPAPVPGRPGPLGLADEGHVRRVLGDAGWGGIDVAALDVVCRFGVGDSDGVDERVEVALGGGSGRALRAELEPRLGPEGWAAAVESVRAEVRARLVGPRFEAIGRTWLVSAEA